MQRVENGNFVKYLTERIPPDTKTMAMALANFAVVIFIYQRYGPEGEGGHWHKKIVGIMLCYEAGQERLTEIQERLFVAAALEEWAKYTRSRYTEMMNTPDIIQARMANEETEDLVKEIATEIKTEATRLWDEQSYLIQETGLTMSAYTAIEFDDQEGFDFAIETDPNNEMGMLKFHRPALNKIIKSHDLFKKKFEIGESMPVQDTPARLYRRCRPQISLGPVHRLLGEMNFERRQKQIKKLQGG